MPQHKSAEKRSRQNERRAELNRARLSKVKTLVKKVRSSQSKEEASIALKSAIKYLDQLAVKGTIHANKASNLKAKMMKFVNRLK